MVYSVIVPVYNRPEEIDELLLSLTRQSFHDFEVLIIEDGSENRCEHIVQKYSEKLAVRYYFKENSGQGFSRNFGFERASGDYFVVFDSDCIIPENYFETVHRFLSVTPVDCWGGPDRAHPTFTPIQKAINYSMTSFFTTGGIRGKKKSYRFFSS
jgi:glycosyltransferase involved in cell wall biosynthesis